MASIATPEEDKDVDVQLLLFDRSVGSGRGRRDPLDEAAERPSRSRCSAERQAETRAQYLDEVTWTTKTLARAAEAAYLSRSLHGHGRADWNELACGEGGRVHGASAQCWRFTGN